MVLLGTVTTPPPRHMNPHKLLYLVKYRSRRYPGDTNIINKWAGGQWYLSGGKSIYGGD